MLPSMQIQNGAKIQYGRQNVFNVHLFCINLANCPLK
jgi:hypothetical protein